MRIVLGGGGGGAAGRAHGLMAQEEQCINIVDMPRGEVGTATGAARVDKARLVAPGIAGLWGAAGAEALGAALLVLLSCLPAALGAPPLHSALAAGAVVAALVQCFDHISFAMFNPAVTLAALLSSRVCWRRAALCACAQLAGGAVGALALAAIVVQPPDADAQGAWCACCSCVTLPAAGVGGARAAGLEAALGGVLALANLAAWDARNAAHGDSWPLRIAATVAALSLAAGGATGASMNPARSFGPALCASTWDHHWVYWVGPLGGSAVATLLYRAAWLPAPAGPR